MKILTVRIPDDLHKNAVIKMAGTPHSFQSLFVGWLAEYLEGEKKEAKRSAASIKRHARLDVIEMGDSPDSVEAIDRNLKAFELLSLYERQQKQK